MVTKASPATRAKIHQNYQPMQLNKIINNHIYIYKKVVSFKTDVIAIMDVKVMM